MSRSKQALQKYDRLLEEYNQMSGDELSKIANSEGGHTELEVKVA